MDVVRRGRTRAVHTNVLSMMCDGSRVMIMDRQLSPEAEQFLTRAVATGMFPSKEAALEAAIAALRERTEEIPDVPDEHMEAVERAIESANAGRVMRMTPEFWERLRTVVRDTAARKDSAR